jgi:hypothetical protein
MSDLTAALWLTLEGMAGLFTVMTCIMVFVIILKKLFK